MKHGAVVGLREKVSNVVLRTYFIIYLSNSRYSTTSTILRTFVIATIGCSLRPRMSVTRSRSSFNFLASAMDSKTRTSSSPRSSAENSKMYLKKQFKVLLVFAPSNVWFYLVRQRTCIFVHSSTIISHLSYNMQASRTC